MLPGFSDGQWWVQDAAAALPARLFGDVAGKSIADLCAAPGGKTAQLAQAGAASPRSTARRRAWRGCATIWRGCRCRPRPSSPMPSNGRAGDGGFDGILVDAPCTSTGTIRRHPDVAWLRQESDIARADGPAKTPAAKGGRAAEARRDAGLLHLFAGARGRRAGDIGASGGRIRPAPRADRGRRSRGTRRNRHRRRRFAHTALPSAACRTPGLAGWTDSMRRGWLNPDFAPDFRTPRLIRALSRWCLGSVSGLKGFARRSSSLKATACRSLNADASRR